ncbi:hypothetical protein C6501_17620 [Candidatus Poribacteria bacterium]|nr:MAG: hypothetical protein C6501_17620 [Candidatus Poribacteria bacterium]
MKNKTDNFIFGSPDIFNSYSFIRKYVIVIVSCVILLGTCTIESSHADTWRDDFDDIDLNGWERIVEENPWFAEWRTFKDDPEWLPIDEEGEGHLAGSIEKPQVEHVTAADFLCWNAHQFQLKKLTVVGEEIWYIRHRREVSGELCLFLGKRQPSPDFAEGYIFSPEKTTRMQFSTKRVFKKGKVKADYGLMFRLTSGDIKVVFDTGKFQLWTQDLLITEFFDADITKIDVVGMMVVFEPQVGGFLVTYQPFQFRALVSLNTIFLMNSYAKCNYEKGN